MSKKTIGVVGGGQLCLMMGEVIKEKSLPYQLMAVDPTPDCPAHAFLDKQFVGDYKDESRIKELASESDIITFEIELANSHVLEELEKKGSPVHPSPTTLKILQDKFDQATFLREHDLPVPDFQAIGNADDILEAIEKFGLPLMIKARKDSYDGKGNFVLRNKNQIDEVFSYFEGRELMAQQFIPFDIEVSVIAARSTKGEIKNFPVGENIHGEHYNILETTIVPARVSKEVFDKAELVAKKTMEALHGAGAFGIEMFVHKGKVLINEIAPRVHNSGHYSVEGSETSQFEQHIKAIAGEPLGSTELVSDAVVMQNIIGNEGYSGPYEMRYEQTPVKGTVEVEKGVFVHNYGKHDTKPYRKMGHFTVVSLPGESQDDLIRRTKGINKKINLIEAKNE